jgi:membrane protease YdiL (CAAX protease family)
VRQLTNIHIGCQFLCLLSDQSSVNNAKLRGMEERDALPEMPRPGGRGHALESLASMTWTMTFLAFSSATVLSEFGTGIAAAWTILVVAAPPFLAGLHAMIDGERGARTSVARYMVYVAMPAVLQLLRLRYSDHSAAAALCDTLAVAALWLPIELNLLPQLGPTGKVSIWAILTGTLSAVNTFSVLRPLDTAGEFRGLGFSFKLTLYDLAISVLSAPVVLAACVPVVVATGYGRYARPVGLKLESQLAVFIGLYFNALAEEILFRGVAQNMLERRLESPDSIVALVVASLMFASSHLKKKERWRAVVVAAVAAIPYGFVFRATGKVTASALTHTVVIYLIRTLFDKRNVL